jgi:hypothetical protein
MGRSIGWGPRLMNRRSLFRISLPPFVWTCKKKKKKKGKVLKRLKHTHNMVTCISLFIEHGQNPIAWTSILRDYEGYTFSNPDEALTDDCMFELQ